MDVYVLFGPEEIARLVSLRDRFQAGIWPTRFVDARETGADITFVAEEAHRDRDRIVYTCSFMRPPYMDCPRVLVVTFQVMTQHPELPGRDEVLMWLIALASRPGEPAFDEWHEFLPAFHQISAFPYRGLIRPQVPGHLRGEQQAREAEEIRRFLGEPFLRYFQVKHSADQSR